MFKFNFERALKHVHEGRTVETFCQPRMLYKYNEKGILIFKRPDTEWDHSTGLPDHIEYSLYQEPVTKKVKLFQYANQNGLLTKSFYTEDFKFWWDGKGLCTPIATHSLNKWKKTNCFIEVDVYDG